MEADTGLVICGKLNKYTEDHHENHQRPGTPPNKLNCLYLNARSVKSVTNKHNKPVELQHILSTFEVHLVTIMETWLTEDVLDSEVLPQNMQCHRKDRSETRQSVRGGGLSLGIDNRLPSKRRPDLECECEILVCEISGPSCVNIDIILVYRPPSSDCATFTSLLDETLCKVSAEYSNICLLGDFNMPNIDWHALDIVSSTADATFIQMTQSHALDQLNTRASNAQGTFLDLLFFNDILNYASDCYCERSHDPVWFDSEARNLVKRKRTMYRKAKRNNTARLWRRYKDFNNSVKTVLKNKHKKFISSLGNSISTGTVPIQWKKANVVLIFKKDDSKVFMSIDNILIKIVSFYRNI
ncbi:hypothetical protein CAPTEDRAFT_206786 [Capitella teleta]|uniref:Endonuclease/exonuclease/phosphatase domain-containing protein n=1 Tax=Capitella teleta TaxID=283909 RepID=R7UDX0_CAPTE|nr:hypothetical protein CAPTEDRAFT_206786 [Capitella teleta]|eukprot:ELU01437.1 hypothetical protein CAPTEDRAFT_206786 [Capitella teleta]